MQYAQIFIMSNLTNCSTSTAEVHPSGWMVGEKAYACTLLYLASACFYQIILFLTMRHECKKYKIYLITYKCQLYKVYLKDTSVHSANSDVGIIFL